MQIEETNAGALAGIHVVDLAGTVATAYCGKLFRDLGATVTNLEPPGEGHPIRRLPPFHPRASAPESSALATWLSLGKRSVAAENGDPLGQRLLGAADVILDAEPRRGPVPRAGQIRLSISWFGATGPYAGRAATDQVIGAHTGAARAVGPAEGPPMLTTGYTAQVVSGTLAYVAGVGQILGRETGAADAQAHLDVSILEAAMCITEPGPSGTLATGVIRPRIGINRFWPTYPGGIYRCRDGWLGVTTVTPSQWQSLCALLGLPALGSEPRYQVSINRLEDADALDAALGPRLLERTAREWVDAGQAARVPLALAPTPAELLELDQYRDRGAWVEAEHPDQGRFPAPGTPFRLHRTPAAGGGRAPRLGEHRGTVTGRADDRPTHSAAAHLAAGGNRRTDLLRDIRIVDLTMGWAGPLATRQLADMGAEVIKVESCQYFDWWRGWESTPESIAQKLYEQSTAFNTTGRNKFGITLDLTSRRGKDLLLELVAKSDAVIENYTASVLPKLGLAYERLREVNPELVMVSMPPFGASGDWMGHRAYGSTVEQASGLAHLNGRAGDPPTMQHVALGDPIAGINAAAALLTALRHLRRTGEGQYVDLSQVESMFPLAAHGLVEQAIRGAAPERCGGRHPLHAPWAAYPCVGAEPWIVITVETEEQWRQLRVVLAVDGAARFAAAPDRKKHEDELDEAIASRTRFHDGLALERRLAAAGVPAAVVRNTMDVLYDPHLEARGFWQWRERAFVGNQPNPSAPYRPLREGHDSRPYAVEWPAPTLGQHNREVLSRLLGLSDAELDALEADHVIGTEPVA
jgi:crotonobetainyl-CoA:carnitine CoA-transferase CaiB-like acyl-CoA transferase